MLYGTLNVHTHSYLCLVSTAKRSTADSCSHYARVHKPAQKAHAHIQDRVVVPHVRHGSALQYIHTYGRGGEVHVYHTIGKVNRNQFRAHQSKVFFAEQAEHKELRDEKSVNGLG